MLLTTSGSPIGQLAITGQLHINIYIPVCIPVSNRMHPFPLNLVSCYMVVCNNHLDVIDVTCSNNSYSFIYLTFLSLFSSFSSSSSIHLTLYLSVYLSIQLKKDVQLTGSDTSVLLIKTHYEGKDQLFASVVCNNLHACIAPIKAQPCDICILTYSCTHSHCLYKQVLLKPSHMIHA